MFDASELEAIISEQQVWLSQEEIIIAQVRQFEKNWLAKVSQFVLETNKINILHKINVYIKLMIIILV